jgi:F5/8 type C domain
MATEGIGSNTRASLRRVVAEVGEFFSLRNAMAKSVAMGPRARAAARPSYDAALARLRGADQLWATGNSAAALALYREAATLFMRASLSLEMREEDAQATEPLALLGSVSPIFDGQPDRVTSAARSRLRSLVASEPKLVAALGAPEDGAGMCEFATAVHWFSDQIEMRTPAAIQVRRIQRVCVAVAVAGALLLGCARWAFGPPNLALHRPVTASSHAYDTHPEGAVDGIRYGQLGFHSGNESSPWLMVDLGRMTALREVRVLGRPECCYDQSLPLALEGSKDGVTFSEIARRTEPFTQYAPWVVDTEGAQAQFVRLRTLRRSYLVVSELEVYGQPL